MRNRIEYAELDWGAPIQSDGRPRSFLYDDVYFSGDGKAESEHVFLAGNDLTERFKHCQRFTIGELGFGTGLNFLTAWSAWSRVKKSAGAHLHFLSVEKSPFRLNDLARAHAAWPDLADFSAKLRAALPPAFPGTQHIKIADDVTLTLLYGDAYDALARNDAKVDAWFLDGFSPAKNPEMWRPDLMTELMRLSAPGATFATFTVAGAVRRALEGAGFKLEKRTGFGRKREMLTGQRTHPPTTRSPRQPWFDTRRTARSDRSPRVAIIGAGIAGASLARALRDVGYAPDIYEADKPASGASGNAAGLIMPRLDIGETPAARFHVAAYLHVIRLLSNLPDSVFCPCGVRHLHTSEKERERQARLLECGALPDGWMTPIENGVSYPQGGVVDPAALVGALIADTPVIDARVITLQKTKAGWRLKTTKGDRDADIVIIANAHDASWFVQMRGLPLSRSAGQTDWFPAARAPETAAAFGPYAAPAPEGGVVIGATYAPVSIGTIPRFSREATQSNIAAIAALLPDLAAALDPNASRPRVAIRCTTPDRLPVVGPVPDWGFYAGAYDGLRTGRKTDYPCGEALPGLYALTGLGSRGLVTAPLCADIIAAEIAGAPAPVDTEIAEALHPARFYIRDLKRNR